MPDMDLDALEAAAKKATPGPWRWEHSYGIGDEMHWCIVADSEPGKTIAVSMVTHYTRPEWFGVPCDQLPNQAYIAAASPDVILSLVARVRELERERDEATIRAHQVSTAMDHVEAERDELAEALRLLTDAGNDLNAALNPLLNLDPSEARKRRHHWEKQSVAALAKTGSNDATNQ